MEMVRALFDTNTFGTMAVTQAMLAGMRERQSGVIINVTSSVTYKPLPLVGVYRAAKMAVNAFSESLAAEVAPFGVRVHLVLPGSSGETRFRETARAGLRGMDSEVYGDFMKTTIARMAASTGPGTRAQDVAEAIFQAATDPASPLRIPAGFDAVQWAAEEGSGDGKRGRV
jgi:NAD(P)-dependent dehydrogenase (short-subunit alcohol dehydrogenase family)